MRTMSMFVITISGKTKKDLEIELEKKAQKHRSDLPLIRKHFHLEQKYRKRNENKLSIMISGIQGKSELVVIENKQIR